MRGLTASAARLARRGPLTALLVAWAGLAALLFAGTGRFSLAAVEAACGAPAPDVRFAPAPAAVADFVAGCGAGGLQAWRDLQVVDLVYPAVGGLVLLALLAALAPAALGARRAARSGGLLALPLVATAADYLENAAAWAVLAGSDPGGTAGRVLQAASLVKATSSWACWTAVLALAGAAAFRVVSRRAVSRTATARTAAARAPRPSRG